MTDCSPSAGGSGHHLAAQKRTSDHSLYRPSPPTYSTLYRYGATPTEDNHLSASTAPYNTRKRSLTADVIPSPLRICSLLDKQQANLQRKRTSNKQAPQGDFTFSTQKSYPDQCTANRHSAGSSSITPIKHIKTRRGQQGTEREEKYSDGPAAKKRRGIAGTIVESALSVAIYTGAAAVTAYTLWSGWSARRTQEVDAEETLNSKDVSPGGHREPPPPYNSQHSSYNASLSTTRPSQAFVSSRTPGLAPITHTSVPSTGQRRFSALSTSSTFNSLNEDDDTDNDEAFARMQARMAYLIQEGSRALQSQASLDGSQVRFTSHIP